MFFSRGVFRVSMLFGCALFSCTKPTEIKATSLVETNRDTVVQTSEAIFLMLYVLERGQCDNLKTM